ncbi:hypothetical protein ACFQU7_41900 [Pseudoroseomonas wenyumeiae]
MADDVVPPLGGVLETGLYVDDLGRARSFMRVFSPLLPCSPMIAWLLIRLDPAVCCCCSNAAPPGRRRSCRAA